MQSFPGGSVLKKNLIANARDAAWEIPWTEEPGGLQAMGLQRVGLDLVTKQQ